MNFPNDNKLGKMFNKNTTKQSYNCLPNMKNLINSLNQNILKAKNVSPQDCNCSNQTDFPFNGYCLTKGIYKATVCCSKGNNEYVGSNGVSFKTRFNQHKYNLNNNTGHQTMLTKCYKSNRKNITEISIEIYTKSKNISLRKVMSV